MAKRSRRADAPEEDRYRVCGKCGKKVAIATTPGGRTIEVLLDLDIRWYIETDLATREWTAKPVHAHALHPCWKDSHDGVEAGDLEEHRVVEGASG